MKLKKQSLISTIKLIQNDFAKAIFNQSDKNFILQIRSNQTTPEFRLSIYRNNILQNLRHTLEIIFPAIWKLVGKECADSLAYAFCQNEKNLPVINSLNGWGANFPKFLKDIKQIKHLVYLKDIAELEWLKHKSYCAADFKVFNSLKLQKKIKTHANELYLVFNPSLHLFSSAYSLKDIIDLIERPNEIDRINLQLGPCYAVITRKHNQVITHWISHEMFDFFTYIQSRIPLMQSYELTENKHPEFDLVAALEFMLKNHLLWKCRLTAIKMEI